MVQGTNLASVAVRPSELFISCWLRKKGEKGCSFSSEVQIPEPGGGGAGAGYGWRAGEIQPVLPWGYLLLPGERRGREPQRPLQQDSGSPSGACSRPPRSPGCRRGARGRRGAARSQPEGKRSPVQTASPPPKPGARGGGVTARAGRSPEEHARAEVGVLQRVGLHLRVHRQHLAGRAAASRGGAAPAAACARCSPSRRQGCWSSGRLRSAGAAKSPASGRRARRPAPSPPPAPGPLLPLPLPPSPTPPPGARSREPRGEGSTRGAGGRAAGGQALRRGEAWALLDGDGRGTTGPGPGYQRPTCSHLVANLTQFVPRP